MAVDKAPYLKYTEVTSYQDGSGNGSEIPVFIVKTNKVVNVSDITPDKVKKFVSYTQFKREFSIPVDEASYNELDDSIKEIDGFIKDFFKENSMYGVNEYGLLVPYIYIVDVGNAPTIQHYEQALSASESKRKSTVALFPNTEDVEFMKQVRDKLMEETKTGLLRIGYFAISGQGKINKFAMGKLLLPTFDHHGYVNVVEGYSTIESDVRVFYEEFDGSTTYTSEITPDANHIYKDLTDGKYYKYVTDAYVETTLESLDGYSEVIEGYRKASDNKFYEKYDGTTYSDELTPNESALYLDKSVVETKAYTYDGSSFVLVNVLPVTETKMIYVTDSDYKFIIPSTKSDEYGGTTETFDEYCDRIRFISEEVKSSRIALVEKEYFGKTIARIVSTPYYLEPGYLPYMSVATGVFKERTKDERDALCMTGIIFNEDDYTLNPIVSRICLGTSTAWGVEDYNERTTDALLHSRRNVDHHIRKILSIVAPQLKRNETSVTIRYVKNQIDLYLDEELTKGTIQEYVIDLEESSYNPYALLIKGRITPVNSTLGIEFENTVGSPYAIASDYV